MILQAAAEVVLKSGAYAMTLEAVAAQAGVGKGGLLYHFPNKEALIEGMSNQLLENFETAFEREIEREKTDHKNPPPAGGIAPMCGRRCFRSTNSTDFIIQFWRPFQSTRK